MPGLDVKGSSPVCQAWMSKAAHQYTRPGCQRQPLEEGVQEPTRLGVLSPGLHLQPRGKPCCHAQHVVHVQLRKLAVVALHQHLRIPTRAPRTNSITSTSITKGTAPLRDMSSRPLAQRCHIGMAARVHARARKDAGDSGSCR